MYFILPFIDQLSLFEQIDSDSLWNDSQNSRQYGTSILCYLIPQIEQEYSESGFALTHYAGNSRVFGVGTGFKHEDCTDGLSNTIMVGGIIEGLQAWGTPGNVRDPALGLNNGPNTFGSPFKRGEQFLFMDGSLRAISDDIDLDVLKALGTPAGGDSLRGFEP